MIVFYSNFLNHHLALVANELYRLTNGEYAFVETIKMPDWCLKSGYPDTLECPYIIRAWKDRDSYDIARELAETADVCLFAGNESLDFAIHRANVGGLSFEFGERWIKRGILNLLSPRLLKNQWYYHTLFKYKPFYRLCSGAYVARDLALLRAYKNRCYNWGYFTSVPDRPLDTNELADNKESINIMWCARFLWWKHPELPIKLAAKLKVDGYSFHINMFGSGEKFEEMKRLANQLDVRDKISFKGNKSNAEILSEMSKHQIFLFTSDRNEGWGAVCNEAMSQNCAVVASHEIGCVPFLINDGVDGVVFKSRDINSLYCKVKYLIDNPDDMYQIRQNAYWKIYNKWSPTIAAQNLLTLIDNLRNGDDTSIEEGPCSKSTII